MLERALKKGYVVLQGCLGPGIATSLRELVFSCDAWKKVFLRVGGDDEIEYDDHRLQLPLDGVFVDQLVGELAAKWKWIYPAHKAHSWHLLLSLPGGRRQAAHVDFRTDRSTPALDYKCVPASILIALQPYTRLHVYGWNRIVCDEDDEDVICLNSGDMLIFRGDMIHAGAAYDVVNVSIHAYLYPEASEEEARDAYITPVLHDQLPSFEDAASRGVCQMYHCDYKIRNDPNDTSSSEKKVLKRKAALQRHLNRAHGARVSKKVKQRNDLAE